MAEILQKIDHSESGGGSGKYPTPYTEHLYLGTVPEVSTGRWDGFITNLTENNLKEYRAVGVRFAKTSNNQHFWWGFTNCDPLLQVYIIKTSSLAASRVYMAAWINFTGIKNSSPYNIEIDIYNNDAGGSGAADVYLFR